MFDYPSLQISNKMQNLVGKRKLKRLQMLHMHMVNVCVCVCVYIVHRLSIRFVVYISPHVQIVWLNLESCISPSLENSGDVAAVSGCHLLNLGVAALLKFPRVVIACVLGIAHFVTMLRI